MSNDPQISDYFLAVGFVSERVHANTRSKHGCEVNSNQTFKGKPLHKIIIQIKWHGLFMIILCSSKTKKWIQSEVKKGKLK